VCQALKDTLVDMGVAPERVTVLRNGVDLDMFQPPEDRAALRTRLGMNAVTLLSVGHLIERKGHDIVIRALTELPDVKLLMAGDGPEENHLRKLAQSLGLDSRVEFLGAIKHDKLRDYYGAADILVLASSREGWANVLLEAMACGTPVVASNVWGTPEVVSNPDAGVLMRERTPGALAAAVRALLASPPSRPRTRQYAERFSWDDTTRGQLELFRRVIAVPNR
jgi:glycosyltransferase involved in cell wall biosynthesis